MAEPKDINAFKQAALASNKVVVDEIKDGLKPAVDALKQPLEQIKAGFNSIPGIDFTKKMFGAVTAPLKAAFAGSLYSKIILSPFTGAVENPPWGL